MQTLRMLMGIVPAGAFGCLTLGCGGMADEEGQAAVAQIGITESAVVTEPAKAPGSANMADYAGSKFQGKQEECGDAHSSKPENWNHPGTEAGLLPQESSEYFNHDPHASFTDWPPTQANGPCWPSR